MSKKLDDVLTGVFSRLLRNAGTGGSPAEIEALRANCKEVAEALEAESKHNAAVVCEKLQQAIKKGFLMMAEDFAELKQKIEEIDKRTFDTGKIG